MGCGNACVINRRFYGQSMQMTQRQLSAESDNGIVSKALLQRALEEEDQTRDRVSTEMELSFGTRLAEVTYFATTESGMHNSSLRIRYWSSRTYHLQHLQWLDISSGSTAFLRKGIE